MPVIVLGPRDLEIDKSLLVLFHYSLISDTCIMCDSNFHKSACTGSSDGRPDFFSEWGSLPKEVYGQDTLGYTVETNNP